MSSSVRRQLFCYAAVVTLQSFTTKAFLPSLIQPSSSRIIGSNNKYYPTRSQRQQQTNLFGILTVNGPFSPSVFANVWGREPLLIRNAFNSSELLQSTFWPSWDDVLELAVSEVEAESRLIRHQPGQLESFTMDLGPFPANELEQMIHQQQQQEEEKGRTTTAWTIVVNDVDRFYTPLTDWMDETFGFLPRWRRDDGQVSLAGKGGGIGPHVDNYDVFLIQTSGVRVWEIGTVKLSVEEETNALIPGLDVRILQQQQQQQPDPTTVDGRNQQQTTDNNSMVRFELRPGDLLYLPPRTVHCGTSVSDDCMTLSVGCRTPAASELASRVVELLSTSVQDYAVRRYVDNDLLSSSSNNNNNNDNNDNAATGLLSTQVRDRMKQLVLDAIHQVVENDMIFDELVGRLVTEPKRYRDNYPVLWESMTAQCPWESPAQAIEAATQGTAGFFRAEGVSFAYSMIHRHHPKKGSSGTSSKTQPPTVCRLYVDGEVFELQQERQYEDATTRLLAALCSSPFELNQEVLEQLPPNGASLLEQLLVKGFLYVAPEDDGDEEEDDE